jgi:hypothetical protein
MPAADDDAQGPVDAGLFLVSDDLGAGEAQRTLGPWSDRGP